VEGTNRASKFAAYAVGFVTGLLIEGPTLMAAVISGGIGHGDYAAARALFPASMLLTLLEGDTIGPISITVGLLQFPIYGLLVAWSVIGRNYLPAVVIACFHVSAAIVCFSGTLPNFS
jgi:hypothetical protein